MASAESDEHHSADDDDEPAASGAPGEARPSKNALKRAARKEALKERFAAKKQKLKDAKARAREERAAARAGAPAELPAAPYVAGAPDTEPRANRSRKEALLAMRAALDDWSSRPSIAIDLSNDALQTEGERTSLVQQLTYCYGLDRRSPAPLPLFFTSVGGLVADALARVTGFEQWPVGQRAASYWDTFSPASIVVLSADASEVLSALEPGMVYVIGGIVDHNRHKGLLAADAAARGLRCARLPLDEHSTLASRKVLTVNHVFQMLLRFYESNDWPDAIAHAIPPRKGLTLHRDAAAAAAAPPAAADAPPSTAARGGAPESAGAGAPAVATAAIS